jgi:hypothetical protein
VKEEIVSALTFYPLECVPEILATFLRGAKPELVEGVRRQIEEFDPEDPYWS